ncbi:MAG: hypothetical protein ABJP70_11700 [Erythrobacter sp.]
MVSTDETGKAAADNSWACEGQDDFDVTFTHMADGTATLTYDNTSEMAAGEPPIVTEIDAFGASAGEEGRYGCMAAEDRDAIV